MKSVAWSQDGQYIATCSRDKTIWIREANEEEDYECVAVASGHTQDVKFVKWHPENNLLFSASYDNTIKCWKHDEAIDDWLCAYTIEGHESIVWCKEPNYWISIVELDFDRTGKFLVSSGEDKSWMIWNIEGSTYENKGMITGLHSRPIYSCTWSKAPISDTQLLDLIATVRID